MWEDKRYMNVDFTPLCRALTLHQLNEIEVHALQPPLPTHARTRTPNP